MSNNYEESELKAILGEKKYNNLENIRNTAERREKFLKNILKGIYTGHLLLEPGLAESVEPQFIIARKWNSWYPSYFDTEGGCYAFLLPDMERLGITNHVRKPSAIVIDPGFKFLDTLRPYGVDVLDIGAIIVTHYHMDHMAGLVEFLTLIHEREKGATCRVFLNETTFQFYKGLQTKNVEFCELRPDEKILIAKYKRKDGLHEYLYVKPFRCHHREIGSYSNALGLVFEFVVKKTPTDEKELGNVRIGILGDTDGMAEYLDDYSEKLEDSHLLVLHLGTVSRKKIEQRYASGESHLYDVGLIKLLQKISSSPSFNSLKSIAISEFGLEMSQLSNFSKILRGFNPPNDWMLFLNLLRSVEKSVKRGPGMDIDPMLNLELQVFGTLSDEYILSGRWLKELRRTQALICLLFGYISYITDPTKVRKTHDEICPNIQELLGSYSPSTLAFSDATKTLKEISQGISSIYTTEIQELAKAIVSLLIRVCPQEKRNDLVESLRRFLDYVGHQALRQMLLRDFTYIAFLAAKISKRIVNIYDNDLKVSCLENLSDLKTIPVSFSSLCLVIALSDELKRSLRLIVNEGNTRYPEIKHDELRFFNELIEILSGLIPESKSLLIGDVGFDAKMEYDSKAKRYQIKLRTEGDFGMQDYISISDTKSVEDENGLVHYRKR